MSDVKHAIMTDATGQAIIAAIQNSEVAQQRIQEINAAAESTKTAAVNAIDQKGRETISSIPDDYSALSGQVTSLKEDLAQLREDSEEADSQLSESITDIDAFSGFDKYIMINALNGIKQGTFNVEIGGVVDDNAMIGQTTWGHYKIPVEGGAVYSVKAYRAPNIGVKGYAVFVDEAQKVLSISIAASDTEGYSDSVILTAPVTAAYLYVKNYLPSKQKFAAVEKRVTISVGDGTNILEEIPVDVPKIAGVITGDVGEIATINTDYAESYFWKLYAVDCKEGDRFKVSAYRAPNSDAALKYVFFLDAQNVVLCRAIDAVSTEGSSGWFTVTAPANSVKMYCREYWVGKGKDYINFVNVIPLTTAIKRVSDNTFPNIGQYVGGGAINQIARLGWDVYNPSMPPEQSVESYIESYKHGCRVFLCDLRITSDGVFVCYHDDTLKTTSWNSVARNTDGSDIIANIDIASTDIGTIDSYDFGIYRGAKYAGKKMLRFRDFMTLCKRLNVTPMVEQKVDMSVADITKMCNIAKMFGFDKNFIFGADPIFSDNYQTFKMLMPHATLIVLGHSRGDGKSKIIAEKYADATYPVGLGVTNISDITDSLATTCAEHNIFLEYSEVQNEAEMDSNLSAINYLKYIASSHVDIRDYMVRKMLSV